MNLDREKTLAIIGQGYVGLPLAMAAVNAGWQVIGVDNLCSKVETLNSGKSTVEDIPDFQLQKAILRGLYRATTNFKEISSASVVIICVPTPLSEKREPDLRLLEDAVQNCALHLASDTLVISESTSYPGTLRKRIIPIIDSLAPNLTDHLYFASAPERVNPGDKIWNQQNTPRLVGGINQLSHEKAMIFYSSICENVIAVESPEIAEAAKLLENTFRLVNIALVNEFAQICNEENIEVQKVIDAAASKPYGYMPFRPGVGVGGHCIPVDPLYLTWWARQSGKRANIVELADSINNEMPKFVAERALSLFQKQSGKPRILILGVSYKAGLADVRETPALALRNNLLRLGAIVAWFDPIVKIWEDLEPVDQNWECDIAIVTSKQDEQLIENLIKRGVNILDCANSVKAHPRVFSL